ncbi:MAG: hypothetical protein ACD_23C00012G0004, partial [uncultured bacterium]
DRKATPLPSYVLSGKTNDMASQLTLSTLIVSLYRIVDNQIEHQTAHTHLPALVAAGRLVDNLTHLFTTYSAAPKVRKTLIDQIASKINRAIGEMAKGRISGVLVNFPMGCDVTIYGLRNCAAEGNTSTLTLNVTMNGRISERYCQGGTL